MDEKILYTAKEASQLDETEPVVLIDIRDKEQFDKAHIWGAVNIPEIFYYLSETTPRGLQDLQRNYLELFSKAGLSPDKTAIVYEDSLDNRYGGCCRGYWLLKYLGHPKAGILDGGLSAWAKAGLPVVDIPIDADRSDFEINLCSDIMATKDDVLAALDDPTIILLDDRDRVEWLGESSSPYGIDFAPRKGRIPGAKWIEWYEFMDRSLEIPAFKSADQIREICSEKEIYLDDDIIIYCFKGARASNTYVALKQAGFKKLRVYFGSWNEWSRCPELPIEQGLPAASGI